jgi:hypothetical protein
MTFENRKKRYDFYVSNGDKVRAAEIVAKYPDVEVQETKSKGKK